MNILLRSQFEQLIRSKTDNKFQEFIVFLFQLAHGEKFTTIKQKRDKGCDGILNGDTVLAGYGPEAYTLSKFKTKVGDDFKAYAKHWKSTHPNWCVVYNGDLLANMITFIDKKHPGAIKVGVPELMVMIDGLPWSKIQRLGDFLTIPTQLLMHDLIGQVVDDLMRLDENDSASSKRLHALFIEDKIALNYDESEIQSASDEYFECLEYFNATELILQGHTSLALSSLRNRIRGDFNQQGGSFAERFRGQKILYSRDHKEDSLYCFAVTVLLTFFFEQCLIGDRTVAEQQ